MKKAPRPTQPDSIEREYARLLLRYQRVYVALVRKELPPLLRALKAETAKTNPAALAEHTDADVAKSVQALFDSILGRMEKSFPDSLLSRWVRAVASRTNKLVSKNLSRQVREATKNKKEGPVEIMGLLTSERKLQPYFEQVVDTNIALIRSIPAEKIPAFRNALVNAVQEDLPVAQLAKIVRKHYAATDNKARLIARDQVGKLNGALDQYHQQVLGGKKYRWRTMRDGAVRHDHERLDGTVQLWSKPPIVNRKTGKRGHPKQDIQCRCYAEAILEELDE